MKDRNHIPAEAAFHKQDRTPTLWLPTHKGCNAGHSKQDQKIGQLIGLRWGHIPSTRDRQLKFRLFSSSTGAIVNLDVRGTIWSWVRGFHAALYKEPLLSTVDMRRIETPLLSGSATNTGIRIDPLLPQHRVFVDVIKTQRAKMNLDTIKSNNGKMTYECVWHQTDNEERWFCIFGLDLYNWKELGRVPGHPARACVGFYFLPSGLPPSNASRAARTSVIIPNIDQLDPFSP